MNRKPIFDFIGKHVPGFWNRPGMIAGMDAAIDAAMRETGEQLAVEAGVPWNPKGPMRTSQRGIDLIHGFETCAKLRTDGRYEAYPDPGSSDGLPWTVGWGSTGHGITRGTIWTKAQCDARFVLDLAKFEKGVREAIGDTPTTQGQFDALVSFHYNTGAIKTATLTRHHKERDYAGAAKQFARWVFNDGKKMRGLERRRAAERELYTS